MRIMMSVSTKYIDLTALDVDFNHLSHNFGG
jgi:hypothetical protein